MTRRLLSIGFDGVLHSYASGWQGATMIADLPTPGAIKFLRETSKSYDIAIFPSRSSHDGGVTAMTDWLQYHGLPPEWIASHLTFPTDKPAAHVSIDDRAIQFVGRWPSLDEIGSFRPWHRLENQLDDLQVDMPQIPRLSMEVMICLESRRLSFDTKLKALGIAAATTLVSEADSYEDVKHKTEWFINRFETSIVDALQIPLIGKHFGV